MSDLNNQPNQAPDSVWGSIFMVLFGTFIYGVLTLFILLSLPNPLTNPSMDDIQFTKGRVTVSVSGYGNNGKASHVKMKTDDGQRMHFTCNHSTMTYTQYSGCEGGQKDEDFKAEVQGKYAEVGWYQPKPFLGFKESRPRMVAFKIQQSDGTWVEKRNLEETMKSMRDMSIFCLVILSYWTLFYHSETKKDFLILFRAIFKRVR